MGSCSNNQNNFLDYLDENKLISCITSFTFIVIFIFIYILKAYTFFDKRQIPRTRLPTAPFGNIKDIIFQEVTLYTYVWQYSNKFRRKGIQFGGLYLFFKPSILVADTKIMKKMFTEREYIIDGHGKHFLKDSTFIDIFSEDNLENFLIKYNVIRGTSLININDSCISTVLHNFFMETTALAFGFKLSPEVLSVVNSLHNKKTESGFKHYLDLVYPLFQRNCINPKMEIFVQNIVDYRKKNDLRERDIMQSFIDLYNTGDYKLNEIILEIFDIFVDNIIYSCNSLLFCLYELACNEDVQQNLIQEIGRFNNHNKSTDLKALRQLSYLDAVIKETLRKYPPIPVIVKKCKEYYNISGTDVELPKGAFIFYSVMAVHYDHRNYLKPDTFSPDRFLEEANIDNEYIPFGFDMRKDIGLHFTVLHIKLALISILSSYSVRMSKKYTMEFDNKKLLIYPKEPLPIIFEPL